MIKSLITTGWILLTGSLLSSAAAVDAGSYVWQVPQVTEIDREAVQPLVEELRGHIDDILQLEPPLNPLRLSFGDTPWDAYWQYVERGRVITTLAMAYPYLTGSQQQRVRTYVKKLLQTPEEQPWQPGLKGPTGGSVLNLHGFEMNHGAMSSADAETYPVLHTLYGLWLFAERTGELTEIKNAWPDITAYYKKQRGRHVLYGQIGGHIAMARLARMLEDKETEQLAMESLQADLQAGQDINAMDARQQDTCFNTFYAKRKSGYFPGKPWMFLNITPETGMFLQQHLKSEARQRVAQLEERYPLWWLRVAPYFTRWTGDEGAGIPTEMMGIVVPVKRWVAGASAEELREYVRSAPIGYADSYWLESLIAAIEAEGTVRWVPYQP